MNININDIKNGMTINLLSDSFIKKIRLNSYFNIFITLEAAKAPSPIEVAI